MIRRDKIPQRKFTDEQLLELHQQGLSDKEIAHFLRVVPSAVWHRRKRNLNLPPNYVHKPWTFKEDLSIIRMRKRGRSVPKIAKHLGRGTDTTYVRYAQLGKPKRKIKINLTSRQLGWLEGLIDGEGCLSMSKLKAGKTTWSLTVHISNTSYRLIKKIKKVIGHGSIHKSIPKNKSYKPVWVYNMPRECMKALLPKLNLTIKENQRRLFLRAAKLLDLKRGRRHQNHIDKMLEKIHDKMKILNKRGK